MKNILLPLDGSSRSLKTIEYVKNNYPSAEIEVTLLMVREDFQLVTPEFSAQEIIAQTLEIMQKYVAMLAGYTVKNRALFGVAGPTIIDYAQVNEIDDIIMTKSTKDGWFKNIGSVTAYVVKNSECVVIIVPEVEK